MIVGKTSSFGASISSSVRYGSLTDVLSSSEDNKSFLLILGWVVS